MVDTFVYNVYKNKNYVDVQSCVHVYIFMYICTSDFKYIYIHVTQETYIQCTMAFQRAHSGRRLFEGRVRCKILGWMGMLW